jgi:hypothetical protein
VVSAALTLTPEIARPATQAEISKRFIDQVPRRSPARARARREAAPPAIKVLRTSIVATTGL